MCSTSRKKQSAKLKAAGSHPRSATHLVQSAVIVFEAFEAVLPVGRSGNREFGAGEQIVLSRARVECRARWNGGAIEIPLSGKAGATVRVANAQCERRRNPSGERRHSRLAANSSNRR